MKFTVAATILTQVLPAISKKNPSKLLEQDGGRNDHDHNFAFLKKKRALKSVFHRGNERKERGETHVSQSRQLLDGLLKNVPFANMKACDPSSDDPDIGILSCDAGYECVSDHDSALGGFCTSVSRDLQIPLYACDLCGDGAVMGSANFDLPVYSVIQGVTCGSLAYTAYVYGMTRDICFYGSRSLAQSAGCCVSYACSFCGEGGEVLADVTINYQKFDGNPLHTCGNIQPVLNDTECAALTPILAPTCCAGAVAPAPAPVATPTVPVSTPTVPVTTPTVPVTTPTVPVTTPTVPVTTPTAPVTTPAVPGTTPTVPADPAPTSPTSASNDRWSTSSLVSMTSLAVVTAGSFLLLN